jgi:hypothetical protein
MDKIYSVQDVVNVVATVEELATINAELEELLHRGSNDEKLVERKRELEGSVRKFRGIVSDMDGTASEEPEIDAEFASLKSDFDSVVSRYKKRKIELQTIIRRYTNGNAD